MKASELRIGNLVKINNALLPETHGKTYSVYKLQKTFDFDFPSSAGIVSLTDKVNRYIQFDQFIEPIQLTEEWFERFGFGKKEYPTGVVWHIGFNNLTHGYLFDLVWLESPELINAPNLPFYKNGRHTIYYVHQLQNLYFALTGEELTLKEEA